VERLVRWYRVTSSPAAVVLLIAGNLVPLVGVLFWGWDVWTLLVLYWIENGIVGVFNVLRMLTAQGPVDSRTGQPELVGNVARATLIPFFIVHYGLFWVVHGVFVFALPAFMNAFETSGPGSFPLGGPPDVFGSTGLQWDVIGIAAAVLAISHGASFVLNYIGRGEYRTARIGLLMFSPYGRLFVLHMTIILGGILTQSLGAPLGALVVLVVLKTALDLALHLREHRRAADRAAPASPPVTAGGPALR
jgi:hypothetical protein